jgi:hypothetical protein
MKPNVFLRKMGLNCDFHLTGGSFDGTLLELIKEYRKVMPAQKKAIVAEKTIDNTESFELLPDIKKVLDGGMDVSIRTGTPSHERVNAVLAQQHHA